MLLPYSILKAGAPARACRNMIVLLRQFDGALTCEVVEEDKKDAAKLRITKGYNMEKHIF